MDKSEKIIEDLRRENEELRNKMRTVEAEKEAYRKHLEKLLPVQELSEEDLAEFQDILKHPENHQTLDELLRELDSELADHGG